MKKHIIILLIIQLFFQCILTPRQETKTEMNNEETDQITDTRNLPAEYRGHDHSDPDEEKKIDQYCSEAMKFYKQYEYKKAADLWQKVLKLDPGHEEAKTNFDKSSKAYQDSELSFYQGLKHVIKEEWEKGMECFRKTLNINPKHEKALYYREICRKKLEVWIRIVDKPNQKGKEFTDRTISTDEKLIMYAIGFDGFGDYIGPVSVSWKSTGTLDPLNISGEKSIKFSPTTPDTQGTIIGYINDIIKCETGKITVNRYLEPHTK